MGDDPEKKIKLTPSADIEKLRPGIACQLIGFVDAIESERRYPGKRVFKFILNNGDGLRVQVNCWGDEIKRSKKEVLMDHVIYLENAWCVNNSNYNKSNFHGAKIPIGTYTNIENLG
ncbi:hypothetical protein KQX54_006360 [Cotesia glomerata]|uniref:Uncharacterized protein n=1 Tax=Cotesia glomerata TaxID=32391 RepID=A0AAV7J1W6_COTGL|nr:hypothetical protein KQX54_006360 [Cotesia glomerata]